MQATKHSVDIAERQESGSRSVDSDGFPLRSAAVPLVKLATGIFFRRSQNGWCLETQRVARRGQRVVGQRF